MSGFSTHASKGDLGVPQNYSGTVLFLSYIAAALALTFSIVTRLLRKANACNAPTRVSLRVTIALISFIVLSYHMSSFLVNSYISWVSPTAWKFALWRWMLGSGLFTDFALELISGQWAVVWTTAALLWTGAVNIWLAVQGRRYKIKSLWQYFALAQILPISFAQSLFAIDLSISRASEASQPKKAITSEPVKQKADSSNSKAEKNTDASGTDDEDAHDDEHLDLTLGPSLFDGPDAAVITFTSIATMYMIYLLPSYAGKPEFMYMVLAVRALLLAPFLVAMRQDEPEEGGMDPMDATFYVALLIIPIALLIYTTVEKIPPAQESLQSAIDGLHTGMATRALGYDLLIGLGSCILMLWGA